LSGLPTGRLALGLDLVVLLDGGGELQVELLPVHLAEEGVGRLLVPLLLEVEVVPEPRDEEEGQEEVDGGIGALDGVLEGLLGALLLTSREVIVGVGVGPGVVPPHGIRLRTGIGCAGVGVSPHGLGAVGIDRRLLGRAHGGV